MKDPTVYSTKCACCNNVILTARPIRLSDSVEAVSLRGVRHVEVLDPAHARTWPSSLYAVSKLIDPSAAEMWLIHGEEWRDV